MFGDVLKQMTENLLSRMHCKKKKKNALYLIAKIPDKFQKEQNTLSLKEVQWSLAKKNIGLSRVTQNTSDEKQKQVNK